MDDLQRRKILKFLLASAAALPVASSASEAPRNKKTNTKSKQVQHQSGIIDINGSPLRPGNGIKPGDIIETRENSKLVFIQGHDAYLMRSNTRLEMNNNNGVVTALRLISGALLAVFGSGDKQIKTPVATIGIRGTGTYFEVNDEETYLCTCYGETQIVSTLDASLSKAVSTQHHEAPHFIRNTAAGPVIEKAPVRNHTDAELILLESTVGREPPFTDNYFSEDAY